MMQQVQKFIRSDRFPFFRLHNCIGHWLIIYE
jgi:hypothetical protein